MSSETSADFYTNEGDSDGYPEPNQGLSELLVEKASRYKQNGKGAVRKTTINLDVSPFRRAKDIESNFQKYQSRRENYVKERKSNLFTNQTINFSIHNSSAFNTPKAQTRVNFAKELRGCSLTKGDPVVASKAKFTPSKHM